MPVFSIWVLNFVFSYCKIYVTEVNNYARKRNAKQHRGCEKT